MQDIAVRRRSLLRLAGAGAIGAATVNMLGGCRSEAAPQPTAPPGASTAPDGQRRVLLAYFSRAGWNYHNGGRRYLQTGNTEVLAGMIGRLLGCDVHRIQAADPYSDDYGDTVARNVREQKADARPAVANPLASINRYDTVLLASGIWNVRAPMIMSTFAESHDFAGKTVHPVTTYAMSGLGTTERDYAASCPGATIAAGLAVRGEEVADADPAVETWLRQNSLLRS
ncbi:flavodoxin [Catellatospora paridis]|uniref:flavodoxin n=1 Tax=Catellatospora paridis TaxID=1617086 RepID=UPI0012D479E5|nr:flavodoxin [Catellatospora paridis]